MYALFLLPLPDSPSTNAPRPYVYYEIYIQNRSVSRCMGNTPIVHYAFKFSLYHWIASVMPREKSYSGA